MEKSVILLNADYSFLNVTTWRRAFALDAKGTADVVEYSDEVIQTAGGSILKIPYIMKLIKFIRTVYKNKVPFSKKNVMVRDDFRCVYCGTKESRFTIDHVYPKSLGGKSTFENCVCSCKDCNNKKGNMTCREAMMFPKTQLIQPTISEFLRLKVRSLGIEKTMNDIYETIIRR